MRLEKYSHWINEHSTRLELTQPAPLSATCRGNVREGHASKSGAQKRKKAMNTECILEAKRWRLELLGQAEGFFEICNGERGHTYFLPKYLMSSHQLLLGAPTATSSGFSAAPRGGSGTSRMSRTKATASKQGMI